MHKYSLEMFINGTWVLNYRYYKYMKNLNDHDLIPIIGKRRNIQYLGVSNDLINL